MTKYLIITIFIVAATYLGLQLFGLEENASIIRPFIVPLFFVFYLIYKTKKRSKYLMVFFTLFSISELLYFGTTYMSIKTTYFYVNSLYIGAYLFLILEIFSNIKRKAFFKTNMLQLIVLLVFDVFCIKYLTEITNLDFGYIMLLEFLYNSVIMIMISLAMLNFFSRPTTKSMQLLIGVFCLVSSEILVVAHHYINDKLMFMNVYGVFFVIGMYFVLRQSFLEHKEFKFFDPQIETS